MPGLIALAALLARGEVPKVQEVLPSVWRVRYGSPELVTASPSRRRDTGRSRPSPLPTRRADLPPFRLSHPRS